MSKYEHFFIMKTYVFFTILGFIQIILCNQDLNITDNDLYSVCPINLFRRKRAHAEYTRWRANQETTSQFIVKVLDDDLTTPNTKAIYGVNIQPITKDEGEKIIIGGALVPPPATKSLTTELLGDYTRFVPPTTTVPPLNRKSNLLTTMSFPNRYDRIIPTILQEGVHIAPVDRHSQRDESPPAGPQFLVRTPESLPRQYAPVEAVVFTSRITLAPLRPTSANPYDFRKSFSSPSRTSSFLDLIKPTRTRSDIDFRKYQYVGDDTIHPEPVFLGKSTFGEENVPARVPPTEYGVTIAKEYDPFFYINKIGDDNKSKELIKKNWPEHDSESLYNMMYYNEEDNEISVKMTTSDDDHTHTTLQDVSDEWSDDLKRENNTESQDIYADDVISSNIESDNGTMVTFKGVYGVPGIEISTSKILNENQRDKRGQKCSLLKLRQLNFNSPRTLPEIIFQLKKWADESPLTKWVDITEGNLTTMENPIYMMIVDDPSSGQIVSAKQTVMIVAGIQGRDHHAVTAAMYVLYQLIERSDVHKNLLSKYRFWVIPVFNPDGYDYSMTFPLRREWSKNLHQKWDTCNGRDTCRLCSVYGIRCMMQPCYGVNLDRNFEYQWISAEELRTEHACGALYAGERQLSEPETRAVTHFLHQNRMPIFTFLAFKEGDVLGIMYPYSHTKKKRAFDHVYRQRASRAASAAYSITGRPYVAGQTSEFLPLYAGGIEDWIDGHLGIDNTYTIMMFRPADSFNSKLITERVVHEAYAAMNTLLLQSMEPLGPQVLTITRTGKERMNDSSRPVPLLYLLIATSAYQFHRYL